MTTKKTEPKFMNFRGKSIQWLFTLPSLLEMGKLMPRHIKENILVAMLGSKTTGASSLVS
jgi:hypothetical protein